MAVRLLDTNATKPIPSSSLLAWLKARANADLFVVSLAVGEPWYGSLGKTPSRKRDELETGFLSPKGPQAPFAGRTLDPLR